MSGPARLRDLAVDWLDRLSSPARALALHGFDRRTDWHFVPRERPGLALRDMDATATRAAWRLIEAPLSEVGRNRVRGVLALEQILGELQSRPAYRDPGNYALALFGTPATDVPWAWRFEGHHLSLSCTLVPGEGVAVTPSFFGANPAVVPHHHRAAGDELLADRSASAFALVADLKGEALERCRIAATAPRDIITGPGSERRLSRMEGLAFARMSDGQRELGWGLVGTFLDHLQDDLRADAERRIREGGLDQLHFAWASATTPGAGHYFRLHGPHTVIEYDNVQDGANHAHAVWHDPEDLFGEDRLRRHYRLAH